MHYFPSFRQVPSDFMDPPFSPDDTSTDYVWFASGLNSTIRSGQLFDSTSRADDKAHAALERLPTELLLQILNLLPPSSQASLSLCSKMILQIIGKNYLENIRYIPLPLTCGCWKLQRSSRQIVCNRGHRPISDRKKEYEIFRLMHDRDNLDLIYCHSCKELHKTDLVREEGISSLWKTPNLVFCYLSQKLKCNAKDLPKLDLKLRRCDEFPMDDKFSTFGITFNRAKLVMKYYRAGLEYEAMLQQFFFHSWTKRYLHVGVDSPSSHYRTQMGQLCSVEGKLLWELTRTARITFGHLLLRTEHKAIQPHGTLYIYENPRAYYLLNTCVHWREGSLINSPGYGHIALRLAKLRVSRRAMVDSYLPDIVPCRYCRTEFETIGRWLPDGTAVLDFVVWQDLGTLETPDAQWKNIIEVPDFHGAWEPTRGQDFETGSIKGMFESSKQD